MLNSKPAKRGVMMMADNKVDGTFHMSFKTKRMKFGVYPMKDGKVDSSRKLMAYSYALYTLKNSPLQWNGSKLINLNGEIGTSIGFSIVDDLKKMGVRVYENSSLNGQMGMLSLGRIAAVVNIESLGDYALRSYPQKFKDIIKIKPLFKTKDYYLMLSHKFVQEKSELAKNIWNEIKRIRETGEYAKIAEKYSD